MLQNCAVNFVFVQENVCRYGWQVELFVAFICECDYDRLELQQSA